MRTLHLDCTLGVSGDMLLAALVEAHPDPADAFARLAAVLQALGLDGLAVDTADKSVASIATRTVAIRQDKAQPLRTLPSVRAVLDRALDQNVLDQGVHRAALDTFDLLARAEGAVHGIGKEQVHFHEIGAVDTICDIVGAHWLVAGLKVRRVTASAVNLGAGLIRGAHGTMPVPPPAVAELAKGLRVFGSGDPETGMEMATPTGMALVRSLAGSQGPLPQGVIERVGYGSGTRSSEVHPSYLRAFVVLESNPEESFYGGGCEG